MIKTQLADLIFKLLSSLQFCKIVAMLLVALFFISPLKSFAGPLASSSQNYCRSYFSKMDLVLGFTAAERVAFDTAVDTYLRLETKWDADSLRIREALQSQLTKFQNQKKYTAQQRKDFSQLFKDAIAKRQTPDKSDADFTERQLEVSRRLERIRHIENEKTRLEKLRILTQILFKYDTDNINEAFVDSCYAVVAKNSSNETDVKEIEFLLEEGANVHHVSEATGGVAIVGAAAAESVEVIHLLIKAGASVHQETTQGHTPLTVAEHIDVIKLLLEAGADAGLTTKAGNSAQLNAVNRGDLETLKILMKADKNLNIQNPIYENAFYYAVLSNQVDIVKYLIQAGANINTVHSDGQTPLHQAITNNSNTMVEILLDANADVYLANRDGRLPLDLATPALRLEIREMIENHIKAKKLQNPRAAHD